MSEGWCGVQPQGVYLGVEAADDEEEEELAAAAVRARFFGAMMFRAKSEITSGQRARSSAFFREGAEIGRSHLPAFAG